MQSANIFAFPGATPPPRNETEPAPAPVPLARQALDIRLHEIAHRLGLDQLAANTIVKHLRTLASAKGFPLPRTTRFWRNAEVTGPGLIVPNAIWNRYEVDQWFDDRTPPAARATRQRHRREQLREEMAGRSQAAATTRRFAASA